MSSIGAVLPVLCQICISSLHKGLLPDCEKIAIITPILKKSDLDPDNAASCRPISILTYLSMLIECLVYSQLSPYMSEVHKLAPWQSAYCEGYSTETVTLKIASDVLDSTDAGDVTILALLDLSDAFDSFITASCFSASTHHMAFVVWCCIECVHSSVTVFKRFSLPSSKQLIQP